jgi:hypothetical protein
MNVVRNARLVALALVLCAVGAVWAATPARAAADYAAIAYSESAGNYGYSSGFSTRGAAENRALVECGTRDAEVLVWGENAYLALAVSDNGHIGWAWADNEAAAQRIALQGRRDAGGRNVRIAVSIYSDD